MNRRFLIVVLAIASLSLILGGIAYAVYTPKSVSSSIRLSSSQDPPWLESYCFPSSTPFTFSWNSSDGSNATLEIWSPNLLNQGQYDGSGASGTGHLQAQTKEVFEALDLASLGVTLAVTLAYQVHGSLLSPNQPAGGPC